MESAFDSGSEGFRLDSWLVSESSKLLTSADHSPVEMRPSRVGLGGVSSSSSSCLSSSTI